MRKTKGLEAGAFDGGDGPSQLAPARLRVVTGVHVYLDVCNFYDVLEEARKTKRS